MQLQIQLLSYTNDSLTHPQQWISLLRDPLLHLTEAPFWKQLKEKVGECQVLQLLLSVPEVVFQAEQETQAFFALLLHFPQP